MSTKSTSIDETFYLLNKIFRYHGLFAVGKLEIIQEMKQEQILSSNNIPCLNKLQVKKGFINKYHQRTKPYHEIQQNIFTSIINFYY